MITDADNRIVRVNRAFEDMTGFTATEVAGKEPSVLGSGRHDAAFFAEMWRALGDSGTWDGDIWNRCADGEVHLFNATIRAVTLDDGTASGHVTVFRGGRSRDTGADGDPTARDSQYDRLTGLPNRHLLADRVDQALISSRRMGKSIALLRVGIDRFTLVNEALGHAAGDLLLREVSQRLGHCVRRSDTIARLVGDQFALVLPITAVDDGVLVAEKVLSAIDCPFEVEGEKVVLSASVGISLFPADAEDAAQLAEHANSAMRHAKKAGGNQYQFFAAEMNVRARSRLELESALRRGLENDQFLVYYQPKVSVESDSIVGMEALVRWRHPLRGMVPPAEFIPVAEESGLIVPLGQWVLRESCLQNKRWQDAGLPPARVSVNVSARQFQRADLVETVLDVLQETGLEPQWLELEITESMLMGDIEATTAKLARLRELGLQISIDDFGTGYSSLSYLSRFPITTLKIDRSFIADIETNRDTAEIARAIIGLSRGLELEVVAEGAETQAHIAFLKEQGCATVQGFYYSRPVPAAEFEKLLRLGRLTREAKLSATG